MALEKGVASVTLHAPDDSPTQLQRQRQREWRKREELPEGQILDHHVDYDVKFYLIHQLHGGLDRPGEDNASLLVFKIEPRSDGHRFNWFRVTLICEKASGSDDQPYIVAAEPAVGGEQVIEDFSHDVSTTWGAKATLQAGLTPFSPGLEGSAEVKSDIKTHVMHTIEVQFGPNNEPTSDGKTNQIQWTIKAAHGSGLGIGDFFNVALVLCRDRGKQVKITAKTEADINSVANVLGNMVRDFPFHHHTANLGPYGHSGQQTALSGIDVNKLRICTNDRHIVKNVLRVGVHIPEKYGPLTSNDVPPETSSPHVSSPRALGQDPRPEPAPVEETKTQPKNHQPVTSTLPSESDSFHETERPDNQQGSTRIVPSDSRAGAGGPRPSYPHAPTAIPRRPWPQGMNPRIDRHFKMASLYQRLAELHREEAEEELAFNNAAYVTGVENERYNDQSNEQWNERWR